MLTKQKHSENVAGFMAFLVGYIFMNDDDSYVFRIAVLC
jgi:hypothetical protein